MLPVGVFAEEVAEAETNLTVNLGGDNAGMAIDLSSFDGGSAGAQFVITAPALKIEICCPTWSRANGGFLTMSLFKFDKDYETTVAGNPIASVRYDEFDDNQWLSLDFTEENPLVPGEYIVFLDEPEVGQASGIWADKPTPNQIFYCDGYIDEQYSLRSRITFVGNPESYFGTPTKPEVQSETNEEIRSDEPYMDFTILFNDPDWDYIISTLNAVEHDFEDDRLVLSVGSADDPQIQFMFNDISMEEGIFVEKYPIMLMKVRRCDETDPLVGEIFFYTETSTGAKAGNNFRFDYENTLEWQTVMIDLSANKRCRDYFTGMRFDVFDHAPEGGTLEIEWITFFESKEAAQKFNGDFSAYQKATPVPTQTPTEKPTEATAAPVATDVPETAKPTDNGGNSGEQNQGDKDNSGNNEKTDKKGANVGLIIGIAAGVIVLALAIVLIVSKAKKKK